MSCVAVAFGECFLDGALEVVDGGWLYEAGDDGLVFNDDLARVGVAGDEDYGDASFGNDFRGGEAVEDGHIEVDKRDVDFTSLTLVDELFAIGDGANNAMTEMFQQPDEGLANVGLIFSDGDANRRRSVFHHMFLNR
jgi:hypothetical protein